MGDQHRLAEAAAIAAAAWRTWIMNEQPPTAVPATREDETMRDRHRRLTRIGAGVENVVPETR